MSRTKKFALLCERKLFMITLMTIFLSLFVAANVLAQQHECEGLLDGTMCWKEYQGHYMPDVDQNQDFDKVLVIDEDFSGGPGLPTGWSDYSWSGGTSTVSGGLLTVDGSVAHTDALYGPGETLEFVATFNSGGQYQHVGFGAPCPSYPMWNCFPWIMFSTGSTGNTLYARICPTTCSPNVGDDAINLGVGYLGSAHTYRIDWGLNSIDFYIDGAPVASRNYSITNSMRAGASDYNFGGVNLTADWIRKGDTEKEYCAPVAEANSLWWLDKRWELGLFEPPDYEVYLGQDINGDGVHDILDLVQELAVLKQTNVGHTGTTPEDEQEGIRLFLSDHNLSDFLFEHTVYDGDYLTCQEFFTYLEEEVYRCQDVKLDLGFWHVDACEGAPGAGQIWWTRRGGHAVSVAGVDSSLSLFAISDPDNDAAEVTGLGVVRPPVGHPALPHAPTVHNDQDFASHDIYNVVPSPSPGGKCGLLNYPAKHNFPSEEWVGPIPTPWPQDFTECIPSVTTLTEIEAAVIVSPIQCGDGIIINPPETCDPPGAPGPGPQGGICYPSCLYCGDGVVNDPGEQCDDGNGVNGDGCENDCTFTAVCGNQIIEPGETCDPPGTPGPPPQPGICYPSCLYCGDGLVNDPGEQCDDGNGVNHDGCDNSCVIEYCGDGDIDPGLGEQCDDGNNIPGDGCDAICQLEFCGDQIIQPGIGETCDPPGVPGPNPLQPGICRGPTCTYCGDGTPNNGEACDDGNGVDGDGCDNDCTFTAICGNQIIEPGEQCDDGNTVSGDGCSATCQLEFCGDQIVQSGIGETCDPPGSPGPGPQSGTCRESCTYCGDGIVNNAEACDDGNGVNGDGCENDCTSTIFSITCNLTPVGTLPIQITRGGLLRFRVDIYNNENTTQSFKFATQVKLPSGNMYPHFLIGPLNVTVNANSSKGGNTSHTIPLTAPLGTYTYYGKVGNAPPPVLYNECQFNFTVVQ